MTAVTKTLNGVSPATSLPSHNHMIGPDLTAGENIGAGDACYIAPNGLVLRAIIQASAGSAVNDVQSLIFQGNISDGSYVIGYPAANGQLVFSAPLAWNANAAAIQTAVQALAPIGAGNVLVTGTYPNFTFTGASALAGVELDQFVVDSSLLIGNVGAGTNPTATPVNAYTLHTTIGQPAGSATAGPSSRVRGFAPEAVRTGQPITLYDALIFGYSDQFMTPGQDVYLSGTVPGGLDTAITLTGQQSLGFAMDNTRLYVFGVR